MPYDRRHMRNIATAADLDSNKKYVFTFGAPAKSHFSVSGFLLQSHYVWPNPIADFVGLSPRPLTLQSVYSRIWIMRRYRPRAVW